ncbi:MAG TPA: sulfotransferase domain-containing protein [Rhizomicrobium sp.]|jgi:hypothetical protein
MNRRAIIALHHKAGTVWMMSTFKGISGALKLPIVRLQEIKDKIKPAQVPVPGIVLDAHSKWFNKPRLVAPLPEDRVLHLVRDPRDIVISSMHYHRSSDESWLHVPRKEFGGVTYQQKINSIADERSRLLFEMDHTAGNVVRNMHDWKYDRSDCFECKYEELILDTDMTLFTQIARHLGFNDAELEICRKQFWRYSLFGQQSKRKKHIRSGASEQWREVFDRSLGEAFLERFGNVLVKMGYEKDDSWLGTLKARPGQAPTSIAKPNDEPKRTQPPEAKPEPKSPVTEQKAASKPAQKPKLEAKPAPGVPVAEQKTTSKPAQNPKADAKPALRTSLAKNGAKEESPPVPPPVPVPLAREADPAVRHGAVLLAYARTGSNNLTMLLNSHPDFFFHGEIFSPRKIMNFKDQEKIEQDLEVDLKRLRKEDPLQFVRLAFASPKGDFVRRGFKLFNDHSTAALRFIISQPEIKLIVLRRSNLLATFSSGRIARETGAWKSTSAASADGMEKLEFKKKKFMGYRDKVRKRLGKIDRLIGERPNVFRIEYDTINDEAVQANLVAFLGGRSGIKLGSKLSKQNAGRIIDRFSNSEQVRAYLDHIGKPEWAELG